jgi:hypothetical protein
MQAEEIISTLTSKCDTDEGAPPSVPPPASFTPQIGALVFQIVFAKERIQKKHVNNTPLTHICRSLSPLQMASARHYGEKPSD